MIVRTALEAAGFSGRDLWRYIHRDLLEVSGSGDWLTYSSASPVVEVTECSDPPGWQLHLREPDGSLIAEALIGRPVDGIGVLWWISTDPGHRGRGMGRGLLSQCLTVLAGNGAHEVIAYVDDDAAADDPERDRRAANRLYDAMGFHEIDRLSSFHPPGLTP